MAKRIGLIAATAVLTLLMAAPASAAIRMGWPCVANDSEANWTLRVSGTNVPLPTHVALEGTSVITGWSVEVAPGMPPLPQRLEAFQAVSEIQEYRKIGESRTEIVAPGPNTFSTRIPVTEGNSIGLHGAVETIFCDKEEGAVSGLVKGSMAVGQTALFETAVEVGTPVTALVEPDADADGYGDETQDLCPVAPSVQTRCPKVVLRSKARVARRAILIGVRAGADARVFVYGQVGWNYRPKGRKGPRNSKGKRRLIVGLSGGRKFVPAGKTARFRVKLPGTVLRRLNRLAPDESVRAKMTIQSTDVAGRIRNNPLRVTLKGRDRSPD